MDEKSSSGHRRRKRRWWPWVVLLAVLAALAWAVTTRPWEPKPLAVAAETVTTGPATRVLAVNGRVVPAQQVQISSTVSGRVTTIDAQEGDAIRMGDVMLTLDDTQQRAIVSQATSSLDAAQAKLQQANSDLERARGLGDSISLKALNDAEIAAETARTEVDRLRASRDQAQSMLAEYVVRAPFDGTVLTRAVDLGQVVSSSTALYSFAALSPLNAEANVDEVYSAQVRRGTKVTARPAGYAQLLEGEVSYVSPSVDTSTGGRLVRVALPDAAGLGLPVGLTVTLNIIVEEARSVITVPRSAIIGGGTPGVYVIEAGRTVRRDIQYVDWPADRLIVTSGLTGGEILVTDAQKVTAGALVVAKG